MATVDFDSLSATTARNLVKLKRRAWSRRLFARQTFGIAIIGIVMVFGTMDLQEIVRGQGLLLGG